MSNKTVVRLNKILSSLRRAESLLGGISVSDTMPVLEAAMPIYASVTEAIGKLGAIKEAAQPAPPAALTEFVKNPTP